MFKVSPSTEQSPTPQKNPPPGARPRGKMVLRASLLFTRRSLPWSGNESTVGLSPTNNPTVAGFHRYQKKVWWLHQQLDHVFPLPCIPTTLGQEEQNPGGQPGNCEREKGCRPLREYEFLFFFVFLVVFFDLFLTAVGFFFSSSHGGSRLQSLCGSLFGLKALCCC